MRTALYIFLGVLHIKYTGARENDFTAAGCFKALRQKEGWVREKNAWGEKGGWVKPRGRVG